MRTLNLRLTVLSPLHIGCGEVYEPFGFVVQPGQQRLVAFNPFDFLARLPEDKLEEFSAVCRKGDVASLLEVYRFIDRNARNMDGVPVTVGPGFIRHHREVLSESNRASREQREQLNQFLLWRTAFNPLDETLYIPGSAIKGGIRTAVLNGIHAALRAKGQEPKLDDKKERHPDQALERELLGGSFAGDPFSRLKVSDFHPLAPARRRLVYAVNKSKSGKPGKAPHQLVEIIEPGAVFGGTVSLTPVEKGSSIAADKVLSLDRGVKGNVWDAVAAFYHGEFDREKREAAAMPNARHPTIRPDAVPLRIGRHSGAECVTVEGRRRIYIMEKQQQGEKKPKRYEDHATTLWFAAGNKDGEGELLPFGWATLEETGRDA